MLSRWFVRVVGEDENGKERMREAEVVHESGSLAASFLEEQVGFRVSQIAVKRQAEMLIPEKYMHALGLDWPKQLEDKGSPEDAPNAAH